LRDVCRTALIVDGAVVLRDDLAREIKQLDVVTRAVATVGDTEGRLTTFSRSVVVAIEYVVPGAKLSVPGAPS